MPPTVNDFVQKYLEKLEKINYWDASTVSRKGLKNKNKF